MNTLTTLNQVRRERYVEALTKIKADFSAAGLTVAGVESHPVSAEKIKLGLPGRDEEIENYRAVIRALVATQAALTVVLAALAPYTAFWYCSTAAWC